MFFMPARRHARHAAAKSRWYGSVLSRRWGVALLTSSLILIPSGAVASGWHDDAGRSNSDSPVVIDGGDKGHVYIDAKLDEALKPNPTSSVGLDPCTAPCPSQQQIEVVVASGGIELAGVAAVYVTGAGSRAGSFTLHVRDLRGQESGWSLKIRYRGLLDSVSGHPDRGGTLMITPSCTKTAGPLTLTTASDSSAGVGDTATLCIAPTASAGSLAGGLVDVTVNLRVNGVEPSDSHIALVVLDYYLVRA